MKLLLDTHAFIWIIQEPEKLSAKASKAYHDRKNEILLSVVSAWEIQIKHQAGKLRLEDPLAHVIGYERDRNNLKVLPVELDHVFALGELERHHADPFDRLLIAQARVEKAHLLTHDRVFARYPVDVLW